jgi:hypothetical protein
MSDRHSDKHPAYWALLSHACAEGAYRKRRAIARGVTFLDEEGVLVYFDSRLPRGSMLARDRLAQRFREHLADAGIRVLGAATFPQSGPDDGRTLAVVLDAGPDAETTVIECWSRARRKPPPPER